TAVFIVQGCQKPRPRLRYDKELPPGAIALRKITDPAKIPDFTSGAYNLAGLRTAIDRSLNYLKKPSSRRFFPYSNITHDHAVDSLKAFKNLVDSGIRARQLHNAILEQFDVYMSVGCDDMGTVLFTGYYTPIFDGSPKPNNRFKYPLYKMPENLQKASDGRILGQRLSDGSLSPYPNRAQIEESKMLKGNELIWLEDPFEVYIAHVQGSAKIRLPDGKLKTVGYAANNGHEYKSVAKELVKDGKISSDQMSLASMIRYFKANIDQVQAYTARNPRFVFFKHESGPPRGSLNEPVTTMRTIATDKSIYPRGCLAFISTRLPRIRGNRIYLDPYGGFALDQDTGGAIRAPGRCDVYMGQGDTAGRLAGQTYQEGKLYYLFLKQFDEPIILDSLPMPRPSDF
ncbi:MAG: murein transglycosylase A, partial [Planctomycetota bacterium]